MCTTDLAGGNAKNFRVRKLHLLCLVFFILCLFQKVECLCRDNILLQTCLSLLRGERDQRLRGYGSTTL